MTTLHKIISHKQEIVTKLMELGGELTPELEQELTINEANIAEKCTAYHHVLTTISAEMEERQRELERIQAQMDGLKATEMRLKTRLLEAVKVLGDEEKGVFRLSVSHDGTTLNFSTRKSVAVEIIDEKTIPADYWRVPELKATPDKTSIKSALSDGKEVPGCALKTNYSLVIK